MTRTTIAGHTLRVDLESTGPGATIEDLDAWLEAGKGGYTREQLSAAFDAVKDVAHWKNPIDAVVDASQVDVLAHAIPYFTGTPAEFDDAGCRPGTTRVTADGYFAGPCN